MRGSGEVLSIGYKVSFCKINNFWRPTVQHRAYNEQFCIMFGIFGKRVDPMLCSSAVYHKRKKNSLKLKKSKGQVEILGGDG